MRIVKSHGMCPNTRKAPQSGGLAERRDSTLSLLSPAVISSCFVPGGLLRIGQTHSFRVRLACRESNRQAATRADPGGGKPQCVEAIERPTGGTRLRPEFAGLFTGDGARSPAAQLGNLSLESY